MTLAIEFHPTAREDFTEIGRHTEEHWGADQARDYMLAITEALDRAAENPLAGTDYSHVREDLRKLNVRSHKVMYIADPTILHVVRILHERMDVPHHIKSL